MVVVCPSGCSLVEGKQKIHIGSCIVLCSRGLMMMMMMMRRDQTHTEERGERSQLLLYVALQEGYVILNNTFPQKKQFK